MRVLAGVGIAAAVTLASLGSAVASSVGAAVPAAGAATGIGVDVRLLAAIAAPPARKSVITPVPRPRTSRGSSRIGSLLPRFPVGPADRCVLP